jgi:hypothetical protein
MLLTSIGGAIIGFELSCDEDRPGRAASGTHLVPTVHASADGATAGIAGSF